MNTYQLNLESVIDLTDDQFYQLCRNNPDLKFERNAQGDLIIMSPTGGETGNRNFNLALELGNWNRHAKLGVCFDSSTGFKFPNGADRSPDIAWIQQQRWDELSADQKERFPPIVPDFVIELMSPSDRLPDIQSKMREYRDNGVRLGWLINRKQKQVEIYRQGEDPEMLDQPVSLSGEEVLPRFTLNLDVVW